MSQRTAAIILAAGAGTRMRSPLPKVLHPCGGLPLVVHSVRLARARRCDPIVVVVDPRGGRRVRELLTASFGKPALRFAVQEKPLGTGDAVRAGLSALRGFSGKALVLYGDVPLLRAKTLAQLDRALGGASLAMLTAELDAPGAYGRVLRNGKRVRAVVEHADATPAERAIREVNAGVYLADVELFRRAVGGLGRRNAQREVYLTDVVAVAAGQRGVNAVKADADEVRGVNTRDELAVAEAVLRRRLIEEHQARGCTFLDPAGTFIGTEVELGRDVVLGVGVQLWGRVKVGRGARIEGPALIRDSVLGPDATVLAFSHVEGAHIGNGARVGPFARLRTGTVVETGAHVGNFVETKKARIGRGAKANHLAYLGDAQIGAASNVGAGTITCNYDGTNKHPTVIGQGVFIGSNTTLVAPLKIGNGAYVAAGSTITKNVPGDALAFGRARQENRAGYAKRLRARIAARDKASD